LILAKDKCKTGSSLILAKADSKAKCLVDSKAKCQLDNKAKCQLDNKVEITMAAADLTVVAVQKINTIFRS
jgi:hypothetical protein